MLKLQVLIPPLLLLTSASAQAAQATTEMIGTPVAWFALVIFVLAYILVAAEEPLQLRKSKPVLVAAGIIWLAIGWHAYGTSDAENVQLAFRHNLLEYAELFLFLLVAMTYINALEERRVFDALRSWIVHKRLSYVSLFWLTGILAFFISPVADNLTTALLMCAVVTKVAPGQKQFINLACVNIVVAANSGGAFSPFGDITTLMVWQKGLVRFDQFLVLFIPSLVSFILPALIMSFFIGKGPIAASSERVEVKRGANRIIILFLFTISTAVASFSLFNLPPVLGMMMGLGYLQFFGYFLRKTLASSLAKKRACAIAEGDEERLHYLGNVVPFDIFSRVAQAEWDTLLFFYGVVMCVGGLGYIGYLEVVSGIMYTQWDPTYANIAVGLLSAVVDNIPIMFAVLTMQPDMVLGQWLLVTLTAGIGGSILSIGSAAGVALMGQARGSYTFVGHLRWAPVISLGYGAAILTHLWLNQGAF
ncbi:sodium:proton antiporter NhaD [Psychromonas sp.]|uniref:sodium:proton antiporter NhaD n=1 Tax=Psychromonas sp. TaxID=1884585 RepID=UPI0035688E68